MYKKISKYWKSLCILYTTMIYIIVVYKIQRDFQYLLIFLYIIRCSFPIGRLKMIMRLGCSFLWGTISVHYRTVVISGAGFNGSQILSLRWEPLTSHPYESYWVSSYRPNVNPLLSASVIGALGQADGVYSNGDSAPDVVYQRPAL